MSVVFKAHDSTINEFERIWTEVIIMSLSQYFSICLEEPRKITKSLSQDVQCLSRDPNLVPTEYEKSGGTTNIVC